MLGFILPLKPKSQSKNWKKDCALLDATIRSLLNQQSPEYKIYVIFSDDPGLNFFSDKVVFVKFPFPFCPFAQIPGAVSILKHFSNDKIILERRWDKSKKMFYGCKVAKEQGCTYVMNVDGDDLLSNRIAGFVEENAQEGDFAGFYIDKGYLLLSGHKRLLRIKRDMQNLNGSTHIISTSLIKIPDFSSCTWMDINLFTSHGWIIYRINEEHNVKLKKIPFPAVIYVLHENNISDINNQSIKSKLKRLVKSLISGKTPDVLISEEFSIPLAGSKRLSN